MGRFSEFLGKIKINVGNKELELEIIIEDLQKFFDFKKQEKEELVYLHSMLYEIMQRNYPAEPEKELKAFVMQNLTELMKQISIAVKLTTKEEMEENIKKAEEESKKK
jgi:hypothetical protein